MQVKCHLDHDVAAICFISELHFDTETNLSMQVQRYAKVVSLPLLVLRQVLALEVNLRHPALDGDNLTDLHALITLHIRRIRHWLQTRDIGAASK